MPHPFAQAGTRALGLRYGEQARCVRAGTTRTRQLHPILTTAVTMLGTTQRGLLDRSQRPMSVLSVPSPPF
jgi:hypothetical protein